MQKTVFFVNINYFLRRLYDGRSRFIISPQSKKTRNQNLARGKFVRPIFRSGGSSPQCPGNRCHLLDEMYGMAWCQFCGRGKKSGDSHSYTARRQVGLLAASRTGSDLTWTLGKKLSEMGTRDLDLKPTRSTDHLEDSRPLPRIAPKIREA